MWCWTNLFVVTLVGIFTFVYFYFRRCYTYWADRGVPFVKPDFLFGNMKNTILKRRTMHDQMLDLYNSFKDERFGGIWQFSKPILLAVDLDLVQDVLVKDFNTWSTRGKAVINVDVDPLVGHLAFLEGQQWKWLRSKLTPTFTSLKLKNMHHLLLECAKDFTNYLDAVVEKGEPVDVAEMTPKFTIDVIGSIAFGIQMNSLTDNESVFRKIGKEMSTTTFRQQMIEFIQKAFPGLFRFLKIATVPQHITDFFIKLIEDTFEYREKNNVRRNDLLDSLKDLKNVGQPLAEDEMLFDDKVLAAQAFVFFGAGFETSSKTISFCLHELAINQDVQDRLRDDIHKSKAANNGEITWEGIRDMKYLHMVCQETLRRHPIIPLTARTCTKPYRIPGTELVLPTGTICMIPINGIHQDPKYYPEPEKFIPERFTDEAKRARHNMSWIPFGGGPRNCIGMRFADQETKMAIVTIIDNFKVSLCEKSQNPLQFSPGPMFLTAERGIWLKISRV